MPHYSSMDFSPTVQPLSRAEGCRSSFTCTLVQKSFQQRIWITLRLCFALPKSLSDRAYVGPPLPVCVDPGKSKKVLRVAYLFPGKERFSTIRMELQEICQEFGIILHMDEYDILRGADLLEDDVWRPIQKAAAEGSYDVVIVTPPCHTHARALHSGRPGPRPLRDADNPLGFPWLFGK